MAEPGLELASGCGRYIYTVTPVFLQSPRHRIADEAREERVRDATRGKLKSICEQIDNSLNLNSPTHPSLLKSPRLPQLCVDKLSVEASPTTRSLIDTPRTKSLTSEHSKSPLKPMKPLGKLTKNKKLSKSVPHDLKNNKISRKGVKKREDLSRRKDPSPDSEADLDTRLDDYFLSQSKRCVTSGNTLADLSHPKLTHQEVQRILSTSHSPANHQLQSTMLATHSSSFQSWRDLLALQMNILVFGLGSKRELLEAFRREQLSSSYHLVINGFFPSLSMKEILTQISSEVIGCDVTSRTLSEHCSFIVDQFHKRDDLNLDLYIVIHNICGTGLQTSPAQFALSQLACCRHIHILASIDLIKGSLLWDQGVLSKFRWVWQHCPTFAPYTEETSYENSFFVQQSGSVALSALVHVMASLTPNARKIFKLLSQQILESDVSKKQAASGTAFYDLYAKCRANFLVNSEQSLRAQLTEFIDHKLVRSRRGGDGVEYLKVSVDQSTLRIYFEEHFET